MPTVRGKSGVKAYFAAAPMKLEKVLRGAARAGAAVIADEIKRETPSDEVRDGLRMRAREDDGHIVVRIDVKPGWARSVGTWLEWGTAPHFISVDDSQRAGRSVSRINAQANEPGSGHSLVIGGNFVGRTVFHPGARPHPAFRPALDRKEGEAIAAAQGFINARVSRRGIADVAGGEE